MTFLATLAIPVRIILGWLSSILMKFKYQFTLFRSCMKECLSSFIGIIRQSVKNDANFVIICVQTKICKKTSILLTNEHQDGINKYNKGICYEMSFNYSQLSEVRGDSGVFTIFVKSASCIFCAKSSKKVIHYLLGKLDFLTSSVKIETISPFTIFSLILNSANSANSIWSGITMLRKVCGQYLNDFHR